LKSVFGDEHAIIGSSTDRIEAKGFWQVWTYQEKHTKGHRGTWVHGIWGWDAAQKLFVRSDGDDSGQWDTATSPGFVGDSMAWLGTSSGPLGRFPFRHTFTRNGEREWTHFLEVDVGKGFVPFERVTCKK
jgi:hypothetical protein